MARTLALCALLGVVAMVSAGSYGNNPMDAGSNCPAKKYNVEGIVSDFFLTATDSNGKNGGFIIDVLELFKRSSNGTFDYKLTARNDGNYQALVDDLVAKKYDIVAADFTVRSERQKVIDFLQPFLRGQVRILTNNNPGTDPNFAHAVVGYNPTWYIQNDVSVLGLMQVTNNATLKAIYQGAQAANRVVDLATGVAAVENSQGPAALIGVSPNIVIANGESSKTSLTDDILETFFYAFGIQQNQNAQRLCLNILQLQVQETGELQTLRNQYNLN